MDRISLSSNEHQPIAKNALTMLINLSDDPEILKSLATDDEFLESLLVRITVCQSPETYARCIY
jgi:hypothetical protein